MTTMYKQSNKQRRILEIVANGRRRKTFKLRFQTVFTLMAEISFDFFASFSLGLSLSLFFDFFVHVKLETAEISA